MGVMALLLCFCICWLSCYAQAASTTEATEPILTENACKLTIGYCCDGTAFSNATVKLYKVAHVSADFQYTLTDPFAPSALILNGVQTNGEWNVIRSTLEANVLAHKIPETATVLTDASGRASFENLETGLYLAVIGQVSQGDIRCYFDSALVALPALDDQGHWQYEVAVNAKGQILPPAVADVQWKVLKLWKGGTNRPKNISVEIFRNGELYQSVVLSQDNQWSYTWTAKDDGATWTVVERNIPAGYKMTVEKRGTSFVLTNTYLPDQPTTPPATGDTTNVLLFTILMYISGGMLIILGIAGKRKRR